MTESNIKRNLLEDDKFCSPGKMLVECDINGWLQTTKKVPQHHINKAKFRVNKKQGNKFFKEDPNSLKLQLKKRKIQLMETPIKTAPIKKGNQSTQANTNQQDSQDCKYNRKALKQFLPLVHINEFKVQSQEIERFQQNFTLKIPRKTSFPSSNHNFRKYTLQKLVELQKLDYLAKQKKTNNSLPIMQQNFCRKKYTGNNLLKKRMSLQLKR